MSSKEELGLQHDKQFFDRILNKLGLVRKSYFQSALAKLEVDYQLRLRGQQKKLESIIEEKESEEVSRPENYIVPGIPLKISDDNIGSFDRFLSSQGIRLNSEQKKVLYCGEPSAVVRAGAGAGKSTVLGLRVLFLVKELRIPTYRITVTTFTRDSRQDFIDNKLIPLFSAAKIRMDRKVAETIVRTYHSIAYEINRKILGSDKKFIMGDFTPKIEESDERGLALTGGTDDKYSKSDHDSDVPRLSDVLNNTYKKLYANNNTFKKLIDSMYCSSLVKKPDYLYKKGDQDNSLEKVHRYDKLLSEYIMSIWREEFPQIILRANPYLKAGSRDVKGCQLQYQLYLPHLNAFVSLALHSKVQGGECYKKNIYVDKKSETVQKLLELKRSIAYKFGSLNYLIVNNSKQLEKLLELEASSAVPLATTGTPPSFQYLYSGAKLRSEEKGGSIFQQMWSLIEYVYALGRSLVEIDEKIIKSFFANHTIGDAEFVKASALFQKAVENEFDRIGVVSPNQVFHQLRSPTAKEFTGLRFNELRHFDHFLIDEFQDISPNVIAFFNALKAARLNQHPTDSSSGGVGRSIMVVGDECQSIYGWRGGSDKFILDFDKHFKVEKASKDLKLSVNYRSSEIILDFAAQLFPLMEVTKEYDAGGKNASDPSSFIKYFPAVLKEDQYSIDYDKLAQELQSEVKEQKASKENPIFIVYHWNSHLGMNKKDGSNLKWVKVVKNLVEEKKVVLTTIHASKGLEAGTVFLLGDITWSDKTNLYSGIYDWVGSDDSFSEMNRQEALRLAYVAITRAERRLYWFDHLNSSSQLGNRVLPMLKF